MAGARGEAGGAIAPPLFRRKGVKVFSEPVMFHCCCAFPDSDQLQFSAYIAADQYQPESRCAHMTIAMQIRFFTLNEIYCVLYTKSPPPWSPVINISLVHLCEVTLV